MDIRWRAEDGTSGVVTYFGRTGNGYGEYAAGRIAEAIGAKADFVLTIVEPESISGRYKVRVRATYVAHARKEQE